jgi:MFS transporter, VNT family, synaptic vesicle glycoprotein 2
MNYKSWRIFLIITAMPSLITAISLHFFFPESPKFTYAQGNEAETLKVLSEVYKRNTGKSDFEVKHLERDEEFGTGRVAKNCGFFKFMWMQTVPLFKTPHLRNLATACFIQFVNCSVCNGFVAFVPEIFNKITIWIDKNPSNSTATVCTILDTFEEQSVDVICFTRLELTPILNVMFMTGLYTAGWYIISFVIERSGKLAVINTLMFSSGLAGIFLAFINIPYVAIVLFMILTLLGLNVTVVASSTIELFPTTLR